MRATFFGHSDAPLKLQQPLEELLYSLAERGAADYFYVGHNGNFDMMAHRALKEPG